MSSPQGQANGQNEADAIGRLLTLFLKVPPAKRTKFARAELASNYPAIVRAFDALDPGQAARTVLFISQTPHSREQRLAAAARLGGWNPMFIYTGVCRQPMDGSFSFHAWVENSLQLALATWMFPGALVHVFALRGDQAYLFFLLKHRRTILDIYDTGAGMKATSEVEREFERLSIGAADGITHRDLRIHYLQKLHGYPKSKFNIFIHDPLPDIPVRVRTTRTDGQIRIVSVGWIGTGENDVIQVSRALCAAGIHIHVHLSAMQSKENLDVAHYLRLAKETPYFHIEDTLQGDAYWEHLSRYDFGMSISDRFTDGLPPINYTPDYVAGCGSSRISDYISANLGVILSPQVKFTNFWARRFAPALIEASWDFVRNPRPVLTDALQKMANSPGKDLSSITVKGAAGRLSRFYERVVAGTRSKWTR